MNEITRRTAQTVVHSKSMSGVAGKGLVIAGGGGLALWFLAGIIPFISLPVLLAMMVVAGIFMW